MDSHQQRVYLRKKLWAEGLSASHIASRLGEVTRNAAIGKVHRPGLSGRTTTSRVKSVRPRRAVARTKRQRLLRFQPQSPGRELFAQMPEADLAVFREVEELVIPVAERKSIQSLVESSCRWPIGDPQHEDFHFCGHDKMTGLPYCEFHARRAFQPAQPRRRDQRPLPQIRSATG